ncbi:MAG: hypothetical protein WCI19_11380 [Betaproteobacteria bacterium]|nr:hypothetical protein [Rhodocyclales bacterium]
MPHVQRHPDGSIAALTAEAGPADEFLPAEHPEVLQFLVRHQDSGSPDAGGLALLLEDLKLIRVIEDLIDLLIAKNVIIFSELPVAVQQKIMKKRGYREKLFGAGGDIIGPEEGIL